MPLPIDIVLVRHGESEGNLATKKDYAGDARAITSNEHKDRHTSTYRLTDEGIRQAGHAGAWIRKHIPGQFDHYLVSPFARAIETAGYLDLPGAMWEIDPYLIERDQGDLDGTSRAEREKYYSHNLNRRALQEFYWRPPNGETRIDAGMRWDRIMGSLRERHAEHRVIIVAHATLIEAGLIRRLHWTVDEFCRWKEQEDEATKVHNCQVIHFSRRDPKTGRIAQSVRWWRTVCPWDTSRTSDEWRQIEKKTFTSSELLDIANQFPRVISG